MYSLKFLECLVPLATLQKTKRSQDQTQILMKTKTKVRILLAPPRAAKSLQASARDCRNPEDSIRESLAIISIAMSSIKIKSNRLYQGYLNYPKLTVGKHLSEYLFHQRAKLKSFNSN